jgi:hypothetical protein
MLEKEGLVHSPHYGRWARIAPETPESPESRPIPSLVPETESVNIQGIQDFQGELHPPEHILGLSPSKTTRLAQVRLCAPRL